MAFINGGNDGIEVPFTQGETDAVARQLASGAAGALGRGTGASLRLLARSVLELGVLDVGCRGWGRFCAGSAGPGASALGSRWQAAGRRAAQWRRCARWLERGRGSTRSCVGASAVGRLGVGGSAGRENRGEGRESKGKREKVAGGRERIGGGSPGGGGLEEEGRGCGGWEGS
jgi:hypothetical protein